VLPVVREVETLLDADPNRDHEYLPVLGCAPFSAAAVALLLGDECSAIKENRVIEI
jgi:aspartate aminotransferase